MYEADPEDPYVGYKYAETLVRKGQTLITSAQRLVKSERQEEGAKVLEEGTRILEEATKVLEGVVERDPGFVSGIYQLAGLYQRTGQREKAGPLFERFKALKDAETAAGSFGVKPIYGMAGKYYMALGADDRR